MSAAPARIGRLAGHGRPIAVGEPANLVLAGGGQGDGVVAVGDGEGGPLQAADPADEAAGGEQPEQHTDRHDGEQQHGGPRRQRTDLAQLRQILPGPDGVDESGR